MADCLWPIDVADCCADTGIDPATEDGAKRIQSVVAQVSAMMARWSGFAFGGCRTIRPLDPCGECRGGCCGSGDCIQLHAVSAVTEVRVHGAEVPETDWHFDPGTGLLCATPGLTWPNRDPRYQSQGSLEVDALTGSAPDAWALAVATELACELLKSCAGKKCRLPSNVTQINGQGITIQMKPDELMYSLPSVIALVTAINPHRATAPARVFSPELNPRRSGPLAPWHRR